MNYNIIFYSL